MVKRLISFSIWGERPVYWRGMLANIQLAPQIYPDWTVRVYYDAMVPEGAVAAMKRAGAEMVKATGQMGGWSGLFWRFAPAHEEGLDAFIVRDSDSRLNPREKAAVDEWLASGKPFHCMRDHFRHNVAIMGGMWGHRGPIPGFKELLDTWVRRYEKGTDQEFLAGHLWPLMRENAIVHDRYAKGMIMLKDGVIVDGPIIDREQIKYEYNPSVFGDHDVRPFPPHAPMQFGTHVGEIIKSC